MFISCSLYPLSLQIFIQATHLNNLPPFPSSLLLVRRIILTMVHFVWLPIKFYNLTLTVCKRFCFQFPCYKSLSVMNSVNGEMVNLILNIKYNNNFFGFLILSDRHLIWTVDSWYGIIVLNYSKCFTFNSDKSQMMSIDVRAHHFLPFW